MFGEKAVPGGVRNAVAMTMVLLIFPIAAADTPEGFTLGPLLILLVFKEVFLGVMIGYLLGMLFWIASSVGFLIDNQRGSSIAGSIDPLSGDETSPLGSLFFQTITMLFLSSGAFVAFIGFLMQSYVSWPVYTFIPDFSSTALTDLFIAQIGIIARMVIVLSGPLLIVCFLTDLGLGLINRFAPQLNVFFLSMPIKSGLVIFILIVYATVLLGIFQDQIDNMESMFTYLQGILR